MTNSRSKKRHVFKAMTWRIIGTSDTIILSWIISGNPFTGVKIGIVETISKIVLYYFHERFWFNSNVKDPNKRHLIKTITWRAIGTVDTILIAWIISGDSIVGVKIGFFEVVTKMLLYYCHEKIWYRVDYGLERKRGLKHEQKYS
ncbi:MAG: DUF2061 domain-containing protein [Bacteroidota bacterium]